MILQQVPEAQDRGLIQNPFADKVDPSETRYAVQVDQAILHRWIIEGYHCCQRLIRSIVASGYGGGPPFLLVLE